MKRVLFIAVILSIAGFCTASELPVQPLEDKAKRAKQERSVKSSAEQVCLPNDPVGQRQLQSNVEQPPLNVKRRLKGDDNSSLEPYNEQQLIIEIQQIIRLLDKKLPNWAINGQLKSKRREIISAFVVSLGGLLKYSPDSYKAPKVNSKFKPLPVLWVQGNRIAYLRVDGFNSEVLLQFRQLHDIMMTNYRLIGLIIDLRNCRSFDYKNGVACLQQLIDVYKEKSPVKVRLAILMGPDTLGVAEYFIHQLRKAVKPVIIGMKSAGQPFEYQSEKLVGGGYLLLPCVPEEIQNKAIFTVQTPTIKIINSPQGDYGLQEKKPDIMVKYASELLIAINATGGSAAEGNHNLTPNSAH